MATLSGAAHANYLVKCWLNDLKEKNKELEQVLTSDDTPRKINACVEAQKSFDTKLSSPESGGL